MKITKISTTPISTNRNNERTSFGSYKLIGWEPFLTEIQNDAARKYVSNMDSRFYRELIQDLQNLTEGKINFSNIIDVATARIKSAKNYNQKAMNEFNEQIAKIYSKIESPSDTEVIVLKPHWGTTKTEKIPGEPYAQSVTDSFINFSIPPAKTDCCSSFTYNYKLGTLRRYFFIDNTYDDFYFAHKLWNNTEKATDINPDGKTPYKRMFEDFTEALVNGIVNLYNNIAKKNEPPKNNLLQKPVEVAHFPSNPQFNNAFPNYFILP